MAKFNLNLQNIGTQLPNVVGLHFGCGGVWKYGWLNTDIEEFEAPNGVKTAPGSIFSLDGYERCEFYYLQHNANLPFPLPDNFFKNCFSEHFIEHVTRHSALKLLQEIYRTMRPNGVLRISTPDLFLIVTDYLDPEWAISPKNLEFLKTSVPSHFTFNRAFAINNTFQLWGHQWIYDFEDLSLLLTEAGFQKTEISRCSYREGRIDQVDILDSEIRKDHSSMYVEAVKL